ncbi:MAG: MBL fold metallo-hydrolase [Saprospiraceae bacterium]|nr:MBL fold metallo-hydrolase [Pyrinomonadaceae bacterium]
MRVEYICHACSLIDTGDLRIVTDPWFAEPAFCEKWYVFPKPVRTDFVKDTDVILISHGHEDHLNEATLKLFPKKARVFYPYSFFGGAKEYIEGLGFEEVKEAVTFKTYKISDKTSVTFIINSHDSVMVIESGGKVLVNANDALHSSAEKVIDFYVKAIRERWPKIDMLFCGFGGASYFPNTIHYAQKDDYEISIVREQLFAHTFCRIVKGLEPEVAVPFAADFCLLEENQSWINKVRFPRSKMAEYYQKYFSENGYQPKIIDMYSGDVLEDAVLIQRSPYRIQMQNGTLDHLIDEQYKNEIAEKRKKTLISETEAEKLIGEIRQNVEKRMTLFPYEELKNLKFSLLLTDVKQNNFYNIAFEEGEVEISRAETSDDNSLLSLELSSKVLRYSIGSDWGADVISVGYGAEVQISDKKAAEVDLERVCMNLLACYPTHGDVKKTPLRTLKFLLLNPPRFTTSIRKLKKFTLESENYDRKTWLLKDAKEIRKRYKLPDLESGFMPQD